MAKRGKRAPVMAKAGVTRGRRRYKCGGKTVEKNMI